MQRDDDPKLWDLLGKARVHEISPFFARNVARAVRGQPDRRRWFSWPTLVPLAGLAVVLIAGSFAMHSLPRTISTAKDSEDAELVADLDDLFASDDDALNEVVAL